MELYRKYILESVKRGSDMSRYRFNCRTCGKPSTGRVCISCWCNNSGRGSVTRAICNKRRKLANAL
jgi:hypothetical protein